VGRIWTQFEPKLFQISNSSDRDVNYIILLASQIISAAIMLKTYAKKIYLNVCNRSGIDETISGSKWKLDGWNRWLCKWKLDWWKYFIVQEEAGFMMMKLLCKQKRNWLNCFIIKQQLDRWNCFMVEVEAGSMKKIILSLRAGFKKNHNVNGSAIGGKCFPKQKLDWLKLNTQIVSNINT